MAHLKYRLWMKFSLINLLLWVWFWATVVIRLQPYEGPHSDFPASPTFIVGKRALPAFPKPNEYLVSRVVMLVNLPSLLSIRLLERLLPAGVGANSVFHGFSIDVFLKFLTTCMSFLQWYLVAALIARFRLMRSGPT